jgi:hypothetical protein
MKSMSLALDETQRIAANIAKLPTLPARAAKASGLFFCAAMITIVEHQPGKLAFHPCA